MGWKWLSKIPGIAGCLDNMALKWAEMRNAQKELEKVTQEKETLKNLLVEEVKEKNKYKEQLEKEKIENRVAIAKYTEYVVGWVIDATYKRIEEKYILVPKNPPPSALALALAGQLGNTNAILGQIPLSPPENKDPKNADK